VARKTVKQAHTGRSVLLVDDSEEYLRAAARVIERDGHEVLTAGSAADGLAILRSREVDLVLVDFLMPAMTGEDFVRELRTFQPTTQVILQTGYASEHPPRELLRRLDIQGYHDKSEGPEKLALWVDVGLKAAFTLQLLTKSRSGLRYVLEATPALHRIQPLEELLQGILLQTAGLLGAGDTFLAVSSENARDEGFVAMTDDGGDLRVRAATGRFQVASRIEDALERGHLGDVLGALDVPGPRRIDGGTVAPLRVGTRTLGLVYLDREIDDGWETEIVEVFANQAAVAIQNVSLYEMAALDGLTGASTRRFFEQAAARELRGTCRTGAPVGLLLVDVDDMKGINDGWGHGAGDRALGAVAGALRGALRATDIVGRIGGDEFAVLLPATDAAGVEVVATRVRKTLAGLAIAGGQGLIPVGASVGGAALEAPEPAARGKAVASIDGAYQALLRAADEAMYDEKRGTMPMPRQLDWESWFCARPDVRGEA